MINIRDFERRMQWKRKGRKLIDLPKENQNIPENISLNQVYPYLSSFQMIQPLAILGIYKLRDFFNSLNK